MNNAWRLLIDPPADGATNMARDEALLISHATGAIPPTLRLYRWQPACLSIGRFQRSNDIAQDVCAAQQIDVVRRPSGGRALLHADELTYTIVVNVNHPLFNEHQSILETYRHISLALQRGLKNLEAAVDLTPAKRKRSHGSAACFDAPASYELTVDGRKLVGSAQARRNGALMQHGAIPFTMQIDRLTMLFVQPPSQLGTQMTTLCEVTNHRHSFDQVAAALMTGFEANWGICFEPGTWTAVEQALVNELRQSRYAHTSWTSAR
ncbi:MAG: lipoate--protein ligase family protein [Chloroflexi bacterium AL-W]|nr:lipoate--protein ligase family protein [Chloroflexi bacterium AL-N1]NOK66922.1 lipoate--protein ligase family protein [Chloroflexi bacterium AL-N10]NOK74786.1 lipoate--protein ligase family protein [Chloroflexi bacterium AL-N5]NOK81524.1 lipoate--protein ligase family protein [Chloroflexi bacterium AL-W]NOK88994.1 lipoate--protein ligase family protein [Chloroflexi bacterium AL-N15]